MSAKVIEIHVQYSVFDTIHALVIKGLTVDEAIAEWESICSTSIPEFLKNMIKQEAQKW